MKTIITAAVLAVAWIGLGVRQANAQEITAARIPFAFVVQGQEFPAGHYEISRQDDVLCIRGIEHPSGAFAMTLPASGSDPAGNQTALVFTKYETEYDLSQVWESDREGFEIEGHATAKKDRAAATIAPTVVLSYGLQVNGQ